MKFQLNNLKQHSVPSVVCFHTLFAYLFAFFVAIRDTILVLIEALTF